jgi:hypothetical protein
MGRERISKRWWLRSYGGMPVWGAIGAVAILIGLGGVLAVNLDRTAIPATGATFTPRPIQTRTVEPIPERIGIADVMPRLDDPTRPFTVAVLGDSTGVSKFGWQVNVATWLGETYGRTAVLHPWDGRPEVDAYQPTSWRLAVGDNAPVEMWNASVGSTKSDHPMTRLDRMIPVATVDLIFVNYGHNHTDQNMAPEGKALMLELAARFPDAAVVGILQNPERAGSPHEAMQRTLTTSWRNVLSAQGFDYIDVQAAFDAQPDLNALLDTVGDLHPNETGYRVWSDAVAAALVG